MMYFLVLRRNITKLGSNLLNSRRHASFRGLVKSTTSE